MDYLARLNVSQPVVRYRANSAPWKPLAQDGPAAEWTSDFCAEKAFGESPFLYRSGVRHVAMTWKICKPAMVPAESKKGRVWNKGKKRHVWISWNFKGSLASPEPTKTFREEWLWFNFHFPNPVESTFAAHSLLEENRKGFWETLLQPNQGSRAQTSLSITKATWSPHYTQSLLKNKWMMSSTGLFM